MPLSMNACGPILVAMESKGGSMVMCNLTKGEQHKPEFLAINPWHHIPALEDGDVKIGESNAILRYLAKKYMPSLYSDDAGTAARIDFALDSWSEACKFHEKTVYLAYGYFPFQEDAAVLKKSCEDYVEAAQKWLKIFKGDKPFVGGEMPCIADYKAVPFLYSAMQPWCKEKVGLEMPTEIAAYVDAFCEKVNASAFLSSAGGYSLKEYAATNPKYVPY